MAGVGEELDMGSRLDGEGPFLRPCPRSRFFDFVDLSLEFFKTPVLEVYALTGCLVAYRVLVDVARIDDPEISGVLRCL